MKRRHAIITGGSSGIGLAIAKILVREGYNISIIARNVSRLQIAHGELLDLCFEPSQNIEQFSSDVSDKSGITAAIKSAVDKSGSPDLLITSAGVSRPGYFQELSNEIFEQIMAVNYFGTVYAVKAVTPFMQDQGYGHIVMISSGAGILGLFGYTAYSPSKFAVRGFAEALRGELKVYGVSVSVVYPPDTDTQQLRDELAYKPKETKAITVKAGVLSVDVVAREIIKGIKRNCFSITPGASMKILGLTHSLIRPLLFFYFDYLVKKTVK
jgi:3-dehydrosphinganine reductase